MSVAQQNVLDRTGNEVEDLDLSRYDSIREFGGRVTFHLQHHLNQTVLCISNATDLRNSTANQTICSPYNNSEADQGLPPEMTFNDDRKMAVIAYSTLFFIAAISNLTVFLTLFRNRHRKSRVNLFIMHLSIADLIVTFIMLPLETIWNITVAWLAGDIACRMLMFFRAFGLYLSSFILVAISMDRYFAILHPLSMNDADKRGKLMLTLAWLFSGIASLPQSVIFHVEFHPAYEWFAQCVTFNFFPSPAHELAYNLFNFITVYALPLIIIIIAYSLILIEMTKKTRESKEDSKIGTGTFKSANGSGNFKGRERLRRSGVGKIERARVRTLRMTIMIVLVFIMCWTPYFVISTWWWFDRESANKVNTKVQQGLFMFAVSNSCMDPIVYGIFSLDFKREFRRCCCCLQAQARQEEVASRVLRQHSLHHHTTTSAANSKQQVCNKNRRHNKDYEHICLKERDNISSGREESFISKNYL